MPRWVLIAISGVLFGAIFALSVADVDSADEILILFVVPIAICALEFGLLGGLAAAMVALALLLVYEATTGDGLDGVGIVAGAIAFLILGGLLGRFVDERRRLDAKVERHFDLSLSLFGTATFDGYFEELNPVWERTFGYTIDELSSKPLIEFVHPDDREQTQLEAQKLAAGIETLSFRNRLRTADGQYRWLEWNVQPDAAERKLYSTARDITTQVEAEDALKNQRVRLEQTVRERTRELEESRLEVLQRLAIAAEYRDDDTHEHTERVGRTASRIAKRLGLSRGDVELIRRAAPLHDIGKVGIPDSVLLKAGPLSPEEFEAMKEHVKIGAKILAHGRFPVLHVARTIALSHHERWNGTGYPFGLRGEAIPLVGRITAVADVFDALTHVRSYKSAWTVRASVDEIQQTAGEHFDPKVVEAFLKLDHARLLHPVSGLRPERVNPTRY
ncbi:MAG TPA: HD domain-containing phosphohydrolase [Solirubrobacterales bacterium]|nr:HD domain-containing phosphohydrolase [Solirubrobacterales bacterium]